MDDEVKIEFRNSIVSLWPLPFVCECAGACSCDSGDSSRYDHARES